MKRQIYLMKIKCSYIFYGNIGTDGFMQIG